MKMIDHNHFICHLILGTFTEYPFKKGENKRIGRNHFLQVGFARFIKTNNLTIIQQPFPQQLLQRQELLLQNHFLRLR